MNTLNHLACIMDGNRRWAYARGLPGIMGHREGVQAVKRVVQFCLDTGISYVSFYAFSVENLQRSLEEKNYLFHLIVQEAQTIAQDALDKDIRMRFIGDRGLFPTIVTKVFEHIERDTAHCTTLQVDILFCYGGQQEMVHVAREIARSIENNTLKAGDISTQTVEKYLWTHGTPAPDLIIRTGGFQRLSNFLLYQSAYAELRFLECMWPDLSYEDLESVVNDFYACQRRFGA